MIEVVEEYLPQIIASVFIILLTPLSKYVSRKIIIFEVLDRKDDWELIWKER